MQSLAEMAKEEKPYKGVPRPGLPGLIMNGFRPVLPPKFGKEWPAILEVITAGWNPNPALRPTMPEIVKVLRFAGEQVPEEITQVTARPRLAAESNTKKVSEAVAPEPISADAEQNLIPDTIEASFDDLLAAAQTNVSSAASFKQIEERICTECHKVGVERKSE